MGKKSSRRRVSVDKTVFIQDHDAIPEGYVALADLEVSGTEYRVLCNAHRSGEIPAVKIVRYAGDLRTGSVFVDLAATNSFLDDYRASRNKQNISFDRGTSDAVREGSSEELLSLRNDVAAMREELRTINSVLTRLVELWN